MFMISIREVTMTYIMTFCIEIMSTMNNVIFIFQSFNLYTLYFIYFLNFKLFLLVHVGSIYGLHSLIVHNILFIVFYT